MSEYNEIPAEQAEELLARRSPALAKQVDFRRDEYENEDGDWVVRLYRGDTEIDSNFTVESDSVLVDGNLRVRGLLSDCGDVDQTLLVVIGDVVARDLHTNGEMIVGGNVSVERLIYANSANDYSFLVHGSVTTQALVEEGMLCWVGGPIEAATVLSLQNEIRQGVGADQARFVERQAEDAGAVFVPELTADGYPEMRKIRQAQEEGRQTLR